MALVMLGVACSASSKPKKLESKPTLTVFVTTEMRGTIEPCGCNSDPLGDISRTVALVDAAKQQGRAVVVLDGGSLLYTEPHVPEHLVDQEALKSDLIQHVFTRQLGAAAFGLGPYDLGAGPGRVRPPRQAANLAPDSGIATVPPAVVMAGGVKIGIFGVVAPAALTPFGIAASDPHEAATRAVDSLRRQGAELVFGLAHMTRRDAVALVEAVQGIDFLVIGQNAPEPADMESAATRVGNTYLVAPANRGQAVARLDITMRGPGSLNDAIGESRAASEIADLTRDIAALDKELTDWKADPSADPAFLASKERELAELRARKKSLEDAPLAIPEQGSYFTFAAIPIARRLPCDRAVQDDKMVYSKAAGKANLAAAAGKTPPPPGPGLASYAGVAACEDCHDQAVDFWKKTRHHQAWETLERRSKEFNYDCIGCHVTGWDQPGGATLAVNEPLRAVQCETCHGPGSLHVASDGTDTPPSIVRSPPETLCKACHNKEHSDTFEYEAYLRDVTGPGHGDAFRQKLGNGPTGNALRSAALARAGRSMGAGCTK